MSRTIPPKNRFRRLRGWLREKQVMLSQHHLAVERDAIDTGLEDHEYRDHCGWIKDCDWCLSSALERLGEIELHEASGELSDDILHVDGKPSPDLGE